MNNLEHAATRIIRDTYARYGRCNLKCECGHEVPGAYLDADAVGNAASIEAVARLIEHARHDHISPRNVLAIVTPIVIDSAHVDVELIAHSAMQTVDEAAETVQAARTRASLGMSYGGYDADSPQDILSDLLHLIAGSDSLDATRDMVDSAWRNFLAEHFEALSE